MGNTSKPPKPKVNANGGEPITMSCGVARSTWRGQASQALKMSRWLWAAALGVPVVPEVKASMAMSSAWVGQALNWPSWAAARTANDPGASIRLKGTMVASTGCCCWANSNSCSNVASHKATLGWALAMISLNSLARSKGMVATATKPALTTPIQAKAKPTELPPRSSTRLPGTRPKSCTSTWAMRSTRSRASR